MKFHKPILVSKFLTNKWFVVNAMATINKQTNGIWLNDMRSGIKIKQTVNLLWKF